MNRLFGKRTLIVVLFLAIGLLSAAQSFGIAPTTPVESPAAVGGAVDWAVISVLAVGALVFLLKPRRKTVARGENTRD